MKKKPCNFHRLQRVKPVEIFDSNEEEDRFFFRLHPERSPQMQALDRMLPQPKVAQKISKNHQMPNIMH